MEKFQKTGQSRSVWDLAKSSTRSIAISTELPEDVINMMETVGPIMEARGLINANTSYSILQYCIIAKIIALDMAIQGRTAPDPELTRFLVRRKKVKQASTHKKTMEYYPGKHTLPVSSVIPIEIAKLAEKYAPLLVEKEMIKSATPYYMWAYCCSSVIIEISRQLGAT